MVYRVAQPNFSKGEISEELAARTDVGSYNTALKKASNVIVLKYGGVTKRPGTRLVAEVYADQGVRLMPFQFSLTQTYVLEMGQGYCRIASMGGLVIEEKLTIASISRGTATLIEANLHGYSVGDQVYLSGISGAADLNGKIGRVLSVPDANHFTVDIDSTTYGDFTSDTGGIVRSAPPAADPVPPVVPPPAEPDPGPDLGSWGVKDWIDWNAIGALL